MTLIKNVCLDTCAIRKIIHENNDFPKLFSEISERHHVNFKIAETAWAEIIQDFYNGSIKLEEWKNKRDNINNFLYKDCPIQEQGYNLSIEMKTFIVPKKRKGKFNNNYWKKCWKIIYTLNDLKDLNKKHIYCYNHKPYKIQIKLEVIEKVFKESRDEWNEYFKNVKSLNLDESHYKEKDILKNFKNEFSKDYNLGKMADFIHVLSRYTYLSLVKKTPYNPESKKRKNDSIDFSFLQLLSKPAIFCSEDKNFRTLVHQSSAPNAYNVKSIQELINYYNNN